jgi:hypothetical protein
MDAALLARRSISMEATAVREFHVISFCVFILFNTVYSLGTTLSADFQLPFTGPHLFDGISMRLSLAVSDSRDSTRIFYYITKVSFSGGVTWFPTNANLYFGDFDVPSNGNVFTANVINRPYAFGVSRNSLVSSVSRVRVEFRLASDPRTTAFLDCTSVSFHGRLPPTPPSTTTTTTTARTTTTTTTTTTRATSSPTTQVWSRNDESVTTTTTEEPRTTTTTTTTTTEAPSTEAPTTVDLSTGPTAEESNVVDVRTGGTLPFAIDVPEDSDRSSSGSSSDDGGDGSTTMADIVATGAPGDASLWIGIGVGAFVLLCLTILLVVFLVRRKSRQSPQYAYDTTTMPPDPVRRPTAVAAMRPINQQYDQISNMTQYGILSSHGSQVHEYDNAQSALRS